MSFNKFAAGRKVYGQGATSPTRGTVDPKGYIKRELARNSTKFGVSKVGNDGQSDTRSGNAARALRGGGIGGNIGNNTGRPNMAGTKAPQQQGQSLPTYNPGGSGSGSAAPVGTPGVAPAPVPAPIQVSPDGVLQLPYNSEFYNQVVDGQQAFDNEMMGLNYEDQQQDLEYAQFMRELESGYVDQQRGTLGNSAGRGTLFSTAHSTGVNRDATQYNNTKGDAIAGDALFNTGIANRRNAAQTALSTLIQRATQGYADSLAADAGSLGYGDDGIAPPAPPGAPAVKAPNKNGNGGGGNGGHGAFNMIPNYWGGNNGGNRPPKPGPNYEWNANKGKWVKK